VEKEGQVPREEMYRTFNMGLGLVAIVAPSDEAAAHAALRERGLGAWTVGAVEKGEGEATCEVVR
jgi:phosphoribosylformylglycinamidine cyclo-ligase